VTLIEEGERMCLYLTSIYEDKIKKYLNRNKTFLYIVKLEINKSVNNDIINNLMFGVPRLKIAKK